MKFKALVPLVALVSLGGCLAVGAAESDGSEVNMFQMGADADPVAGMFEGASKEEMEFVDDDDEVPQSNFLQENMQDSTAVQQEAQEEQDFVEEASREEIVLFKEDDDEEDDRDETNDDDEDEDDEEEDEQFKIDEEMLSKGGKKFLEGDADNAAAGGVEEFRLEDEAGDALMDRDGGKELGEQTRNRLSLLIIVFMTLGTALLVGVVMYCACFSKPAARFTHMHMRITRKHYVTRPENLLDNEKTPLLGIANALFNGLDNNTQTTGTIATVPPPAYSFIDPYPPGAAATGAAAAGGVGGAAAAGAAGGAGVGGAAAAGGAGVGGAAAAAAASGGSGPMILGTTRGAAMFSTPPQQQGGQLGGQLPPGFPWGQGATVFPAPPQQQGGQGFFFVHGNMV